MPWKLYNNHKNELEINANVICEVLAAAHFPNGIIFKFNPSIMPILFLILILLFLHFYPLAISLTLAMKLSVEDIHLFICVNVYKKNIINRMNFFNLNSFFLLRVLILYNEKNFSFSWIIKKSKKGKKWREKKPGGE